MGALLRRLVAPGALLIALLAAGCTSNPTPYPGHGDAHYGVDDTTLVDPPGEDSDDASVGASDDALDPSHGIGDVGTEDQRDGDALAGGDDVRILVDDVGRDGTDDDEDDEGDEGDDDFRAPAAERVDDR